MIEQLEKLSEKLYASRVGPYNYSPGVKGDIQIMQDEMYEHLSNLIDEMIEECKAENTK